MQREKDTLVFFSIPYDKGWSATVNGKTVEVEKVNVGFMAVPVKSGESEIVFTYKTPGLSTGITVSLATVVMLVAYIALAYILNKKHPQETVYPEGEELLGVWERDENEELLIEELPEEIEIEE